MNDWTHFKKYLDNLIIKTETKISLKPHVAEIYGHNVQLNEGLINFYSSLLGTLNGTGTLKDALGNEMEVNLLPAYQAEWDAMFKIKKNTYRPVGSKNKNYRFPNNVSDLLKRLWNGYRSKDAQTYVELMYSPEEQKELIYLELRGLELKGSLDLNNFISLERAEVDENELTELKVDNCPNLTLLWAYMNNLEELDLTNNKKLKTLDLYQNYNLDELKVNYSQLRFLDIWRTGVINLFGSYEKEKTQWLWENVFRNVENHYPTKLAKGITQLVDIKDIEKLVAEFDWEKFQSEEEYKLLFCEEPSNLKSNGYTSNFHISFALQYLNQQVLMRCLIKQNELNGTCDDDYRQYILDNGKKWDSNEQLDNPYKVDLKDIQKSVNKELEKQKNPEQTVNDNKIPWEEYTLYGIGGVIVVVLVAWVVKSAKKMGV